MIVVALERTFVCFSIVTEAVKSKQNVSRCHETAINETSRGGHHRHSAIAPKAKRRNSDYMM